MISAKPMAVVAMLALAGAAFAQEKADEQRIAELIQQLENDQARGTAVEKLVEIGKPAIPHLINRLIELHGSNANVSGGRSDPARLEAILRVIGQIRPTIDEHLLELFQSCVEEPRKARYVIRAVGDIAPYCGKGEANPADAVGAMAAVAMERNWLEWRSIGRETTRAAARGTLRVDSEIQNLVQALTHEDAYVREVAAELLCYRKVEATGALKALREALLNSHLKAWISFSEKLPYPSSVHDTIAWAMVSIGPDDPASSVAHAYRLRHHDAAVRLSSAQALQNMKDPATVQALIQSLAEETVIHIRYEAITALGMIGPAAKDAIPTLEKLPSHDDPQIAHRAKAALRQVRGR